MQNKKIRVNEVFKSTSREEIDNYLKEKIVKLMLNQQKLDVKAI